MGRVLIATADPGLARLCRSAASLAGHDVGAEAATTVEATSLSRRIRFSAALLDATLPGGCMPVIAELVAHGTDTHPIVLSEQPSTTELMSMLRAGAVGYLPRSVRAGALARALISVMAGEAAISRSDTRALVEELRNCDCGQPSEMRLSDRELIVLQLLAEGCSTAEIGRQLYIAKVTVRSHIASIVKKLNVPDRASAVAMARSSRYFQAGAPHPLSGEDEATAFVLSSGYRAPAGRAS